MNKANRDTECEAENTTTGHVSGVRAVNCPSLLSGMSHEVRTHMNSIVAFSYLLKENNFNDAERDDFSRQIQSSCEQLIQLVDNFLDSAIIDSGSTRPGIKECKPATILNDLMTEFRDILARDVHKGVVLVAESSFGDPGFIRIDNDSVFRVIRILFQNALRNTHSGYIKIGYTFRDNTLTFHVIDSGQGYSKCKEFLHTEDLNQSLTQFNDTVTAINITLANQLISILGGTVWIECNGITGSAIYFTVPVKTVAASPEISINRFVNPMMAI
ncbi:MAG TPA: HAMP domain-containing sensor histidine kinase [Bacteroidales bacterium]|nr:HAMP domain-containing sensor histidine kinase [Bacteroidales bacterium]HPF03968.1 HAMP domain-containing sensor histidine kinase [Bacteroidales bacterium]HPJ58604.1 HAMP domain-containing sensor histidine kinase [Bacteroidales bacterium]HPR11237.1 HAMP domain-containing sensor histidine kinase [Bacteroidales bacterium]HRW85479.1 HAMP domain-containing sensor histidine kinase [Bacteroidales bacterium]